MDLGSIIIGAILIAACILPVVLMSQIRKKRAEKTIQSLFKMANQQNCNISKHEICGDFVIGIDETKKFVFFIKYLKDKTIEQFINLADIQKCKTKNTVRKVAFKNGSQNVIDKLELSFVPFEKNMNEISMEFFNTDSNTSLDGELQSLEEWHSRINLYLTSKK